MNWRVKYTCISTTAWAVADESQDCLGVGDNDNMPAFSFASIIWRDVLRYWRRNCKKVNAFVADTEPRFAINAAVYTVHKF